MRSGLGSGLCFLLLSQLEKLEPAKDRVSKVSSGNKAIIFVPGQSGIAGWVVDIFLRSNNLLAEGVVHTSWLRPPPWCWSCSPGSLWSPLRNALCWELAELLLLLRRRLEPLRLWCGLLWCTRRRRVGLGYYLVLL